jgi:hypothetical protein
MTGWEAVVPYEGNSPYCYSSALRMCLETWRASESPWPSVGFLESLSTMPFGVFLLPPPAGPKLFFSPLSMDPDLGLERAVDSLGARWRTEHPPGPVQARGLLRRALEEGPVLAGPLDLSSLPYHDGHEQLRGVDHYVVITGLEGDRIRIQDPGGYPEMVLPQGTFFEAWRAEGIPFPHHPYTFRWELRRTLVPSSEEMFQRALPRIVETVRMDPGEQAVPVGPRAVRQAAEAFRGPISPEMRRFHAGFSFPLGARRSADAAVFLRRFGLGPAADLFAERARLLGEASYALSLSDGAGVARALERLAGVEESIRTTFSR